MIFVLNDSPAAPRRLGNYPVVRVVPNNRMYVSSHIYEAQDPFDPNNHVTIKVIKEADVIVQRIAYSNQFRH